MAKHRGESIKTEQAGPLPQAVVGGLHVHTRSHAIGQENNEGTWTLHADGSSTAKGVEVGLILKGPSGET